MFGNPAILMIFNENDVEKLFRREGQYPMRKGLDTLTHYRNNIRSDIYGEFGSVGTE